MDLSFVPTLRLLKLSVRSASSSKRCLSTVAMKAPGADCVKSMRRFLSVFTDDETQCVPIDVVSASGYSAYLEQQSSAVKAWLSAMRFNSKKCGSMVIVPRFGSEAGNHGDVMDRVIFTVGDERAEPWTYAELPKKLPTGMSYLLTGDYDSNAANLGWALGSYEYKTYKSTAKENRDEELAKLKATPSAGTETAAASTFLVRDLINIPAGDLSPKQLETATQELGELFDARTKSTVGQALLDENFPMIHAVGRAAVGDDFQPRLIEMRWGEGYGWDTESRGALPLITLVGKGVCYDTGGLNLKPGGSMRNMKKDMGGAATVLGLAAMIMSSNLNLHLRVLIPAVENSIAGNAYRPGDVLSSRSGITVEIDNTDAEGRLVLADALALAVEDKPDLIIDCATLTGAQRIALGTEIPSSFTNNVKLGNRLQEISSETSDLIWELPLHRPYRRMLDSSMADMKNASAGGYGGAITAALFLLEFVGKSDAPDWIHIDQMGYNVSSRPGRPEGGEAQGMRALFELLRRDYPCIE